MKLMQERYKNFDRLLGKIVSGMAAVAILGASIILFAALWGILHHDNIISENRMDFSPKFASFSPVP